MKLFFNFFIFTIILTFSSHFGVYAEDTAEGKTKLPTPKKQEEKSPESKKASKKESSEAGKEDGKKKYTPKPTAEEAKKLFKLSSDSKKVKKSFGVLELDPPKNAEEKAARKMVKEKGPDSFPIVYKKREIRDAKADEWPEGGIENSTKFMHQAGGFLTHSAKILKPGGLSLSTYFDFFKGSDFFFAGDSNTYVGSYFNLRYGFNEYVEGSLWMRNASNQNDLARVNVGSPEVLQALGDLGFLLKASYKADDNWTLSFAPKLEFAPEVGGSSIDFAATRITLESGVSFKAPEEAGLPANLHLNLDFKMGSDFGDTIYTRVEEFIFQLHQTNRLSVGLGVDATFKSKIQPFLEYRLTLPVGTSKIESLLDKTGTIEKKILGIEGEDSVSNTEFFGHEVALGMSYNGIENLSLFTGLTISPGGITSIRGVPNLAPYKVGFGVDYLFDSNRKVIEEKSVLLYTELTKSTDASLSGKVIVIGDKKGSKDEVPDRIEIYFSPNPFGAGFITTKEGKYNIRGIPPGTYEVKVFGENIKDFKGKLTFKPGEKRSLNMKVKLKPKLAKLKFQCLDSNGLPVFCEAEMVPKDKKLKVVKAKAKKKGLLEVEVAAGEYVINMNSGALKSKPMNMILLPRQSTMIAVPFSAPKLPESLSIEGQKIVTTIPIDFEKDLKTLKPEAETQLDDVATLLQIKSDMKIKVIGHTDSRGKASQLKAKGRELADGVKKYLTDKGIDASRLVVDSKGGSMPISSGRTKRGRMMNYRVEFEILKK